MGRPGCIDEYIKRFAMNQSITYKETLLVIKIGGNVIDDAIALRSFLKEFAAIKEKKILVHGGGKIATFIGDKMDIKSQYIDGRRITDDDSIDLVTMVYGGLVNKKIVALLQSLNCNAIGLTGADGNLIPAIKRSVNKIDYGWVGDINTDDINPDKWKIFLDHEMIPVMAPLTHDGAAHLLNTNADTIASVLSVCLSKYYAVKLIYCFEKDGVLLDVDDSNSIIKNLSVSLFQQLKEENKLFAGILPKIDNAFDAASNGVAEVIIGNSEQLIQMTEGVRGTKISTEG